MDSILNVHVRRNVHYLNALYCFRRLLGLDNRMNSGVQLKSARSPHAVTEFSNINYAIQNYLFRSELFLSQYLLIYFLSTPMSVGQSIR
jgi:hypothetical protein